MARSKYDKQIKRDQDYGAAWDSYRQDNSLKGQRCACGSTTKLQRHHVIKASKVSSHAPAYIEILCEECHTRLHPHMRRKIKWS
jgi:5-methylcytosine-specific restriction endonuclease McrA